MSKPDFERMLKLIDEVFATRNDPEQIQVSGNQMQKLQQIHPATLSEVTGPKGPKTWVLVIPTSGAVREKFLQNKITEKQLLDLTEPGDRYQSIYLCSATTLPEYRGKGETKKLCLSAIDAIRAQHPITSLMVWPFTREGEKLAETLAKETGLTLYKKQTN